MSQRESIICDIVEEPGFLSLSGIISNPDLGCNNKKEEGKN
jgi:hypothetical protein